MNLWLIIFGGFFLCEYCWRRGYFLWLAMIAGLNALVLTPLSSFVLISFFLIFGSVAAYLWHGYIRRPQQPFEHNRQERDAKKYWRHVWRLSQPIIQGRGKELLGGSLWYLHADQDLPQGTEVTVHKISGVVFYVKPVAPDLSSDILRNTVQ